VNKKDFYTKHNSEFVKRDKMEVERVKVATEKVKKWSQLRNEHIAFNEEQYEMQLKKIEEEDEQEKGKLEKAKEDNATYKK
jgi:hypothetical protein